jgi:hypothetical protein
MRWGEYSFADVEKNKTPMPYFKPISPMQNRTIPEKRSSLHQSSYLKYCTSSIRVMVQMGCRSALQ